MSLFGLVNGQTTYYGVGAGTAGYQNSYFGAYTGSSITGSYNTGIGYSALRYAGAGGYNVAVGVQSLYYNSTGTQNLGSGYRSLYRNTTGSYNIGIGSYALHGPSAGGTGKYNIAIGYRSSYDMSSGENNISLGFNSLENNTSGDDNIAIGEDALENNVTGSYNTAIGSESLKNNTGAYNTAVGFGAGHSGTTASYSTAIGEYAVYTASSQVRIGNNFIASIGGYRAWTNLSDGRFKKEVKENVLGLEFINNLRPVSYYVDNDAVSDFLGIDYPEERKTNTKKSYQTGFIAQEVEATTKELGFEHFSGVDAPQNEQSHYGLRYAEFVVPLVKSVQELSKANDKQTATIESLKELIAQQQLQINELLANQGTTLNTTDLQTESTAKLYQNTPNPFTEETQINMFIPTDAGQALVQVCTIEGKQLFVKEIAERKETSMTLKANDLPAGIYMYTLIVDNRIVTSKRMVLTK